MKNLIEQIHNLAEENVAVCLRLENRILKIGEELGNSRHNADREDSRDFPEYSSEEYNSLAELQGTSTYGLIVNEYEFENRLAELAELSVENCMFDHAYIVIADETATHDDSDEDEILCVKPKVVIELF